MYAWQKKGRLLPERSKNKKQLKRIKSKVISRSANLLGVGLKTTARAAGLAFSSRLTVKEKRKELYDSFLLDTVKSFTSEIEKLKGGVMKAGQLLSIYGEHFFPEEINRVLKKLQSDSQPVAFKEMEKVLKKSLGKEIYELIDVDPEPIGAASIGQVHKAVVRGEKRALKIQYPGISKSIDSDLRTIRSFMTLTKLFPDPGKFEEIYKEIREMIHRESDYTRELRSLSRYRELIAEIPGLDLPKAYPEYSSPKVLCMDLVGGRRFDDPLVKGLSQERRNRLGVSLLTLLFKEIFEWRSVQTDPHVGNFLVQIKEDGYNQDKIILLDFGAVRNLPKTYVDNFRKLALASIQRDGEGVIRSAITLGFLHDDDPKTMKDLFVKIVLKGTEPFQEKYEGESYDGSVFSEKDYDWAEHKVMDDLAILAKDAIFSFKFRAPPREAIFVDRKLVGTSTILRTLGVKYGPRKIALKYLQND